MDKEQQKPQGQAIKFFMAQPEEDFVKKRDDGKYDVKVLVGLLNPEDKKTYPVVRFVNGQQVPGMFWLKPTQNEYIFEGVKPNIKGELILTLSPVEFPNPIFGASITVPVKMLRSQSIAVKTGKTIRVQTSYPSDSLVQRVLVWVFGPEGDLVDAAISISATQPFILNNEMYDCYVEQSIEAGFAVFKIIPKGGKNGPFTFTNLASGDFVTEGLVGVDRRKKIMPVMKFLAFSQLYDIAKKLVPFLNPLWSSFSTEMGGKVAGKLEEFFSLLPASEQDEEIINAAMPLVGHKKTRLWLDQLSYLDQLCDDDPDRLLRVKDYYRKLTVQRRATIEETIVATAEKMSYDSDMDTDDFRAYLEVIDLRHKDLEKKYEKFFKYLAKKYENISVKAKPASGKIFTEAKALAGEKFQEMDSTFATWGTQIREYADKK
ncbi:MAG TPA: hypothetical protein PKD79_00855 [Candidatus Doudnabacteria bacterium]|nr:hypothetical protein [Candidatus Doudnabacteria bacterium]